ncbi:unnamed protein product [Polarella glacialis]|uniref:Uncharacterized protein n=1 Tax=Polarella glacialis TaxID=89957 RepID=A0A813JBW9_POLGL|nr:unnamed protein product [Polarella glacialis]
MGGDVGYSIGNKDGKIRLAYFPDDEEEVKDICEELRNFCASYMDHRWNKPKDLGPAAKSKLWATGFEEQLRKNFNVTKVPEWQGSFLLLFGKREDVYEADEWLTNQCEPEAMKSRDIVKGSPKTFILRHSLNRARRIHLHRQLEILYGCQVSSINTGESIFRSMGPVVAVEQRKIESAELLRAMESDIEICEVPSAAGKAQFLQNTADAKEVTRKLTDKGVWLDCSNSASSTLLADCCLPNACGVEVRHGDATTGGFGHGLIALVSSANGQFLSGEVGGIAGDMTIALSLTSFAPAAKQAMQILLQELQAAEKVSAPLTMKLEAGETFEAAVATSKTSCLAADWFVTP